MTYRVIFGRPRGDATLALVGSPRGLILTLILTSSVSLMSACRDTPPTPSLQAYMDRDVAWALGEVQLTPVGGPAVVIVTRQAASVGSKTPSLYSIVGAAKASDTAPDQHALQYVDFHPTESQLLAYVFELDYIARAQSPNVVDVWAVLRKGGLSYYHQQRVWLGSADFAAGVNHAGMTPAPGLKISQIASGIGAGQWAMHYPDATGLAPPPWQGMCPKVVTQSPGQTAEQAPGQSFSCRPTPAAHDLCGGTPLQPTCQPERPTQKSFAALVATPAAAEPDKITTGLKPVDGATAVYAIADALVAAKVVFSSATLTAASDEANASACANQFYAVARSVDRQLNASCILKPAPAAVQNGKLSCGVSVTFDHPQTFLEKVCNISAVFHAASDEVQHIQVLIN